MTPTIQAVRTALNAKSIAFSQYGCEEPVGEETINDADAGLCHRAMIDALIAELTL